MSLQTVVETDVLVIGGGIAGCFAAIKARDQGLDVMIVDKAYAGKSGASIAAGMGYMVFTPEWGLDLDACMNAINIKGEYLNNREWTEIVFKDSWADLSGPCFLGCRISCGRRYQICKGPPAIRNSSYKTQGNNALSEATGGEERCQDYG